MTEPTEPLDVYMTGHRKMTGRELTECIQCVSVSERNKPRVRERDGEKAGVAAHKD